MVGKIVRFTRPSRSSPRNVSVSMRCEMAPIIRLSSLKRRGPSPSSKITSTLRLSPIRASTEATARQSLPSWLIAGKAGTFLCSGFKIVPSCASFGSHAISVSYKLIPKVTDMKLLHIDSSVLGPNSVSRQVTAAVVEQLGRTSPGLEITYRALAAAPLNHLSGAHLAAAQGASADTRIQAEVVEGAAVLEEFLAADIVVIGAPMYNFSVPSQLKAWIDRIAVAGKTFKYGPNGPEGLAGSKKIVVISSRGGVYSAGPAAGFDHQETYLRSVFAFLGIEDIEFVR